MSSRNAGRRTIARHGQLRSPGVFAQLMKLLGIAAAVVAISAVAVTGIFVWDLTRDFAEASVDLDGQENLPPDIGAFEGGFNLLLVGVDTCEEEYKQYFPGRCDGKDAGGTLNDVNILVHVSDEPRKVTAISFPRDLMGPIPSCTDEDGRTHSAMSKQPLNSAWHYGGLNCVAKTISGLSEQPIHFAAAVTFGGVIEITDAIGGVEVCLASPIRDRETHLNMAAGTHEVSGLQALQFLRTRYGVGDGSDLGRIGNQQQYMSNLVKKLVDDDTLGDPRTLLSLARTGLDNVTPSTSLTNPVLVVQIALVLKNVPFEDIVFVQYPVSDDPADSNKVVPNYSAANVLWDALAENKTLEITRTNTNNDGVVVMPAEGEGSEATPAPSDTQEPSDVVALPESIRGNSVAQTTCSNGKQRR